MGLGLEPQALEYSPGYKPIYGDLALYTGLYRAIWAYIALAQACTALSLYIGLLSLYSPV